MHFSPVTTPLFSFGTLMDHDVLACVAGQSVSELSIDPAIVRGYVQREVVGQDFPVLIADDTSCARGVVISGLTDLALQRILFFEGEEYELAHLPVEGPAGMMQARYFKDTAVYDVCATAWNFETWRHIKKNEFLRRTQRFMKLFGTMSALEADAYW